MILPILISVSVAPVSYFFWARALPGAKAIAVTAAENAAVHSVSRVFLLGFLVLLHFAEHLLGDHRDLPGAVGHEEDDEEQEHAEHRA
jgi:hypothetical protein